MSKSRLVSIVALVCAARTARANDWTELGSDSGRSRDSSEVSGPIFAPSWTFALNSGPIIAAPVTSGGDIVIAGSAGAVAALNAVDGSVVWKRTLAGGVIATPMVSNEQVAVATAGGALYSLSLADGGTVWQRSFGGQNYSSPQLVPRSAPGGADSLIIGAGFPAQDVWRFDVLTGEPVWKTAAGAIVELVSSSAAVVGNRVVIGMDNGRFQSLDLATGATGWKFDVSGDVKLSSPLVAGARVYMFPGDKSAQVFAADAGTGAPIAGFPVAIPDLAPVPNGQMLGHGPAISSPIAIGGLVIVELRRNDFLPSGKIVMRESVAAIDQASASVRWQYALASETVDNYNGVPQLGTCPTPAGFSGAGDAYVAISSSIDGRITVLDAQTGQPRWTSTLSSPGRSSPVFSNGQLLIATDDGVLRAFSSTTNRAPTAPAMVVSSGVQAFFASGTAFSWQGASDPEGGALSYVVRAEQDGHPETRSDSEASAGQTQTTLVFQPSTAYLLAVRSRDAQGALSAWSVAERIQIGVAAPVVPTSGDGALVGVAPTLPSLPPPSEGDTPPATAPPSGDTTPAADTMPAAPAVAGTMPPALPPCPLATANPAPTVTVAAGSSDPSAPMLVAAAMMVPAANDAHPPTTPGALLASLAANAMVPAPAPTSGESTSHQAAATAAAAELAQRGGCSVAGGGTSPMSILGVALLALVVGRRSRRSS